MMTTTSHFTHSTHASPAASPEAKHHCSTQMAPCPYEVAKPLTKPSVSPRKTFPVPIILEPCHSLPATPLNPSILPMDPPSPPWPLLLRGLGSLTESNPFDHPPPALAFGAWFLASSSEHLLTTISTTRDLVSHTKASD